jgi:hypothetical protein
MPPQQALGAGLGGSGVREKITEFVNDFLPDLVFEQICIARGPQHSRLQNLTLLVKQLVQFDP